MSDLSRLLGLDRHPDLLSALNSAGHELASAVLPAIEQDMAPELVKRLTAVGGKFIDLLPVPDNQKGLAKLLLTSQLATEVQAVMAEYEHFAEASSAAQVIPTQFVAPTAQESKYTVTGSELTTASPDAETIPQ